MHNYRIYPKAFMYLACWIFPIALDMSYILAELVVTQNDPRTPNLYCDR